MFLLQEFQIRTPLFEIVAPWVVIFAPKRVESTDGSASHPYRNIGRGTSPRCPTFYAYPAVYSVERPPSRQNAVDRLGTLREIP